jgi:outer membrane protein assembly factor BamB
MPRAALLALLALATCDSPPETCGAWLQWGGDPTHAGATCSAALPMARQLGEVQFDPFIEGETADGDGDIYVHYQVPLIAGDDVYIEAKSGAYTPCTPPMPPMMPNRVCAPYRLNSESWDEVQLHWDGNHLVQGWTFHSDWKPPPFDGFEPMFQPAIVGDRLYVPAAGGAITIVDRHSGATTGKIAPFAIDPDTYVASPVAADSAGNVYYTTLSLIHDDPWNTDAHGFLVKATPEGTIQTVPFESMVADAPIMCRTTFNRMDNPLPWPPPPNPDGTPALPPLAPCGTQRPGLNAAPAIAPDGTIYLVSKAHMNARYSYVIALNGDLTPKWSTSLRGFLHDGCGVTIPLDGDDMDHKYDCRPGTTMGVDPATNEQPATRVIDDSSSSPVALPDGGVLYGSHTSYNDARGHLVKLDAGGHVVATYDFGWDTTPAIYRHDGTYSILLKDNHYLYDANGVDLGPYYIVRLDKNLKPEWKLQSTNTMSCTRVPGQTDLVCTDDHPHGFEWCINAPAVDRNGTVYANSEDGWVYAIDKNGRVTQRIFLDMSIGAAYTPLAIDGRGLIYTLNAGKLSVVGP